MKVADTILQSVVGLLLGAGVGAIVGFVTFAFLGRSEKGSGMVMFAPSGPLAMGILGAVLLGVMGVVIGLITGVFSLRATSAAVVAILIFAILNARTFYDAMRSDRKLEFIGIEHLLILLDFVVIGVSVALSLRYFFAGRAR